MIRQATHQDIPALIELGERMHAESPRFCHLTFSRDRLGKTLASLIDNPMGFLWVAQSETVYGGFAGLAYPHWACEEMEACDLALFIDQERRGSPAAIRLIHAYVEWARGLGVVKPQIGVVTGIDTEKTVALLERLGMRRCGAVMEA